MPGDSGNDEFAGFLGGLRVLEIGDELGEYCGKVLAGLGADVVRVEPPGGESTRMYGPFYHDEPDPARSLYFWHYNLGKRSIVLDLDAPEGREAFAQLAQTADVVVDTRPRTYLPERGIGYEQLSAANPGLIWARITPFTRVITFLPGSRPPIGNERTQMVTTPPHPITRPRPSYEAAASWARAPLADR